MAQDFKDMFKLIGFLLLPFAFAPLAASCQAKETLRLKTECIAQGGQPIISPRHTVSGCVLGR